MSKDVAIFIDGNSIINRAFFAIPVLTTSAGVYTNAVYGFMNIMLKLFDDEKPKYAAVAFDLPGPTFRHKNFEGYKATRKSMPQELRPQFVTLKDLLSKMGIAIFECEGYEADDILGALATKSLDMGLSPIVVSGDRDLLQICTDTLEVRIPKTKGGRTEVECYFAADVEALMGVTPTQYIDVKALMGDASDNIPGVAGIGEKTAVKIIQEYGSLDNALDNIQTIRPPKAAKSLSENRELAILSKKLATIITDVPISFTAASIALGNIYNEASFDEVRRLEFKSLMPRFSSIPKKGEDVNDNRINNTRIIEDIESLEALVASLSGCKEVSLAYVSDKDKLVGFAIATKSQNSYVSLRSMIDWQAVKALTPLLSSVVYVHDLKAVLMLLSSYGGGATLTNAIDASLAAYMLDSSKNSYSCFDISESILGEHIQTLEDIQGKGKTRLLLSALSPLEISSIVCREADVLLRATPIMMDQLRKNGEEDLYNKVELPLARVLCDMQIEGISVNREELSNMGIRLDETIAEVSSEIFALAQEEFNLNSPAQLGVILFEKLGLKGSKKTKTGYSTAADVLEKLKGTHPIIGRILKYRTYAKLKSTYIEGLTPLVNHSTGKIHSTFSQTVASTGRISSSEPNMQNIPVRLDIGRELRRAFVPSSSEYIFLDADYSQIELRVLAGLSGDSSLISAFENGQDIHRLTASQVFATDFELVTPMQRNAAKAVNFGIVYGIGAYSLSQDLDISVKEAEEYIAGYFMRYPLVKSFMDESIEKARSLGYAQTFFGRRRPIPELASSNFNLRSFGERAAMNMPIQGTAADIIKIAMIRVNNSLRHTKSKLVLQVHDELLLEVHRSEIEEIKAMVLKEMTSEMSLGGRVLPVPLECNFSFGESWYDTK